MKAKIHSEEKQWGLLLKIITEYASFEMLEEYENILNEKFPDKLIQLYEGNIRNYIEKNVNRKHYEIACKAIRRFKKIIPDQMLII